MTDDRRQLSRTSRLLLRQESTTRRQPDSKHRKEVLWDEGAFDAEGLSAFRTDVHLDRRECSKVAAKWQSFAERLVIGMRNRERDMGRRPGGRPADGEEGTG